MSDLPFSDYLRSPYIFLDRAALSHHLKGKVLVHKPFAFYHTCITLLARRVCIMDHGSKSRYLPAWIVTKQITRHHLYSMMQMAYPLTALSRLYSKHDFKPRRFLNTTVFAPVLRAAVLQGSLYFCKL